MKAILRSVVELMAWLPLVWIVVLYTESGIPLSLWIVIAWLAIGIGTAMPHLLHRRIPPILVQLAFLAGIVAVAAAYASELILYALLLGAMFWLSGSRLSWINLCALGLGWQAAYLLLSTLLQVGAEARPFFLVCGTIWFVALLFLHHKRRLEAAGLYTGIVTRSVSSASRRYMGLLVVVVLIVFAATSAFSLWTAFVRLLNRLLPHGGREVEDPPPQESATPPSFTDMLPQDGPAKTHWIWTVLTYAVYGVVALALLFLCWQLLRRYLLKRVWWRSIAERLRAWYEGLLSRRKETEQTGYTEERESLLTMEKVLGRLRSGLSLREVKQLSAKEWQALPPAEQVRRVYAATVTAGMREGYTHRAALTPTETLAALAAWQDNGKNRKAARRESRDGLWSWLAVAGPLLRVLYGRARYGKGELKKEEVEQLMAQYPWKK